jgi:hypothetical protein
MMTWSLNENERMMEKLLRIELDLPLPMLSAHQTFDDFQPAKVDSVVQRWMTKRIDCIIVSHR